MIEMTSVQNICRRAVQKWGAEKQTAMLIEELGELIVAVHHYKRRRVAVESVTEEIADTLIMLEQALFALGISDDELIEAIGRKAERLEKRL
jgi:NTP pyrophosphatase (non-canonical NTP hydrolase)